LFLQKLYRRISSVNIEQRFDMKFDEVNP
jgi:hypothetical protein